MCQAFIDTNWYVRRGSMVFEPFTHSLTPQEHALQSVPVSFCATGNYAQSSRRRQRREGYLQASLQGNNSMTTGLSTALYSLELQCMACGLPFKTVHPLWACPTITPQHHSQS